MVIITLFEVFPVGPVCLPFNKVLHKEEEVILTLFGVQ